MNMPGFTAATAFYRTKERYWRRGTLSSSIAGSKVLAQARLDCEENHRDCLIYCSIFFPDGGPLLRPCERVCSITGALCDAINQVTGIFT